MTDPITLFTTAANSLKAAKDIGVALTGLRDWNLVAEKVTALNNELLNAQDALFSQRAALLQLQDEHFKCREELRKVREALDERKRYTLVDMGCGYFAYRMNLPPEESHAAQPAGAQAMHYVCQRCFDIGRKVVLQPTFYFGNRTGLCCHACGAKLNTG